MLVSKVVSKSKEPQTRVIIVIMGLLRSSPLTLWCVACGLDVYEGNGWDVGEGRGEGDIGSVRVIKLSRLWDGRTALTQTACLLQCVHNAIQYGGEGKENRGRKN